MLIPLYTGLHEILSRNSEKRWFEIKPLDARGKLAKASVDLIKPYYSRKSLSEADDPKADITFRTDLELADNFEPEGNKASQLPVFKADKREGVVLEGGNFILRSTR